MMNKKVLSIAGSDCSGGAGIQADLKVMCAYDVYGMSVITAVTAQNTMGVQQVETVRPELVEAQLASILEDIRPDAVKIGMVSSEENIRTIAKMLRRYQLTNIIIDPVMISTSGKTLLQPKAAEALFEELFPLADLITPNLSESMAIIEYLGNGAEKSLEEEQQMEYRAEVFVRRWDAAMLIKGGHLQGEPADYGRDQKQGIWFEGERIETVHTHGTGCTLSAAIACNLALGKSLWEAVREAKEYLTGCIRHNPGIGRGHGPMNHLWRIEQK